MDLKDIDTLIKSIGNRDFKISVKTEKGETVKIEVVGDFMERLKKEKNEKEVMKNQINFINRQKEIKEHNEKVDKIAMSDEATGGVEPSPDEIKESLLKKGPGSEL